MKVWTIMALLWLMGCRTVKTRTKAREELKRDVELSTVVVKAGQKETNTVTYWPDGNVYQLQQVREQVERTKLGRLDVKEHVVLKRAEKEKRSVPVKIWVYVAGIAAVLLAGVWVYWKFKN